MTRLDSQQVNTWRLARHFLLERAAPGDMIRVVSRVLAVQAQMIQAAELAIWARVEGLAKSDVLDSLWNSRALVKSWFMRGTLHLAAKEDFSLLVSARQAHPPRRPPSWFAYHKVTPDDLQTILEAVPAALSDNPITREQLAERVAGHVGSEHLREVLLSG